MNTLTRLFDPSIVPWKGRRERAMIGAVFVLYIAVLVWTACHHEMWRDEVRALTLARSGESVTAMLHNLRHEGHPAGWYFILRAAFALFATPLVLPVMSALIAIAAVAVMLVFAPFAPGQKTMLAFGGLLVYEYAVMARNYGIGALLLFVLAAAYDKRQSHPVMWGALLAVLANTSVHAAVLAIALTAAWVLEWGLDATRIGRVRDSAGRFVAGVAVAASGIAACVALTKPPADSVVTAPVSGAAFVNAAVQSIVRAGEPFATLLPLGEIHRLAAIDTRLPEWGMTALFALFAVGLWGRWAYLAAFLSALFGLGVVFRVGYPASLRHAGLLYVLMLVLYWRVLADDALASPGVRHRRVFWALTVPLSAVMALQLMFGVHVIRNDTALQMSASKDFGAMLRRPEYAGAVVVGEPDYYLEALPYYAPNRLYSPRMNRLFDYVLFDRSWRLQLSLTDLIAAADSAHAVTHAPVLIALAHDIAASDSGDLAFHFRNETHFTWTRAERDMFALRTTRLVTYSGTVKSEEYTVYALHDAR